LVSRGSFSPGFLSHRIWRWKDKENCSRTGLLLLPPHEILSHNFALARSFLVLVEILLHSFLCSVLWEAAVGGGGGCIGGRKRRLLLLHGARERARAERYVSPTLLEKNERGLV
jgi:hypothetical protein